jgi:diguanylate cyclase (GGDEF)-like protein
MNASAWSVHANNALSRSARTGQPVAVLVVDIDHFKPINDTHGHLIGDEVLVAVATCLRRELRGHDGLGRFGGDEFVAILEQLAPAAAEQVGERLRSAVSSLQVADRLSITVSIGLAHGNADDTAGDIQGLLERADAALYLAKSSGRNRLCTAGSGRR